MYAVMGLMNVAIRERENDAQINKKTTTLLCKPFLTVRSCGSTAASHTHTHADTHVPMDKIAWTPKCQGHPQSSKTITLFLNQSSNES